ncbi:MAG: HYR domain-containing protein [Acidobacteriota bacterium]|nr:HYR domain-containing protein [Acidobacteriota bacterium]
MAATAAEISRVAPEMIRFGNPEEFLSIYGSGLDQHESVVVTFSGAGQEIVLEPSSISSGQLEVWVPFEVVTREGRYAVSVTIKDGTVVQQLGPLSFSVAPALEGPPNLILPEAIVIEAKSPRGMSVPFHVVATTFTGQPLTAACDHESGALYPIGTTHVLCSATDNFGTVQGEFDIVVADFTPPVVTVPADFASATSTVTFEASAIDDIDGAVPVSCSPQSGSVFEPGVTEVVCVAYDAQLNPGLGIFRVTVGGLPPQITVPQDITYEAEKPEGAVVTFEVSATNNGTITCNHKSGDTFPIGKTVVQCTATNTSGSASGSFNIIVQDTTAPQILKVEVSPDTIWPPDHKMVRATVTVVTFDLADVAPVSKIISVTSNQPVNGTGDGDMAPDWKIVGDLKVDLRAERSGDVDRVYTIRVETTDASGNSTTADVTVRVSQSRRRSVR